MVGSVFNQTACESLRAEVNALYARPILNLADTFPPPYRIQAAVKRTSLPEEGRPIRRFPRVRSSLQEDKAETRDSSETGKGQDRER